jgi:hypothetical protein
MISGNELRNSFNLIMRNLYSINDSTGGNSDGRFKTLKTTSQSYIEVYIDICYDIIDKYEKIKVISDEDIIFYIKEFEDATLHFLDNNIKEISREKSKSYIKKYLNKIESFYENKKVKNKIENTIKRITKFEKKDLITETQKKMIQNFDVVCPNCEEEFVVLDVNKNEFVEGIETYCPECQVNVILYKKNIIEKKIKDYDENSSGILFPKGYDYEDTENYDEEIKTNKYNVLLYNIIATIIFIFILIFLFLFFGVDTFVYGYWLIFWIGIGGLLGIVLHEFGHKIFCDITGVEVYQVKYLNSDTSIDADGFVIHEKPSTFFQSLMITIGPMLTVGIPMFLLWFISFMIDNNYKYIIQYLAYGLFFAMFPSTHDVRNLYDHINENIKEQFYLFIFYPITLILYLFSFFYVKIILIFFTLIILSEVYGIVNFFDLMI